MSEIGKIHSLVNQGHRPCLLWFGKKEAGEPLQWEGFRNQLYLEKGSRRRWVSHRM